MAEIDEIKKKYNIMSAKELIKSEIPKQEWIVEGLIPKQSLIVWTGKKASFKSFFNKYLGICIATGKSLFGEFEVTNPGVVLYLDEENGSRRLKARISKICNGLGFDEEKEIEFYTITKKGFKLDGKKINNEDINCMKVIEKIIQLYKPTFVVCDSVVRMMKGDENSSMDVRRIYDNLSPIMEKYGCTFSLIHHSCKDGTGFRGSGDFEYMADKTFVVERKGNSRTEFKISQEKERDDEYIGDINFEVHNTLDDKGINVICTDKNLNTKAKRHELAAEDIKKLLKNGQVKSFKTMDLRDELNLIKDDKGKPKHKYSAVTNAFNMLEEKNL